VFDQCRVAEVINDELLDRATDTLRTRNLLSNCYNGCVKVSNKKEGAVFGRNSIVIVPPRPLSQLKEQL
jgi:hypothetical protein